MPADPSLHTAGPSSPSGGAVARRARPIYRVFVSSTWLDLQPERRALMEALNRMEEMRFVGMEFFGNRPDDTHDASIDQVDLCEVFIGIIGFRYGSGITEAEYRRARALNLPCFVYFKRGEPASPGQTDQDPALAAKLAAFKQDLLRGHTVKEVGSPEELAASATADLHNWVAARWISLEREEVAVRPAAPVADADRTNILRLIERIDQDWIKGVLEASLHHRAWLELGLDWREDAVEHPWDRIVVAANRPIQTLSKEDSISGVFDAAQHTLLVLGEPGAGKTTTVLELARDLIVRARGSAVEPAPVVLALSTWQAQHKDLMDWLVAELGLRYQVPKRVARAWLEEGRLVLILDGLDEVAAERRAACVDAINAFEQEHHPRGLAVTCRVAEYNALTTKLRLRSAICLQPLTPAQIDRYFQAAGTSLDPLRSALQEDAGLRELARSPLMLSVMTMAWRDAPAETTAPFATALSPEDLRRRLFDAYVKAALHRHGKAGSIYTPEQTIGWLSWLARRMKENGLTLFAVEQLQPGWLAGARSQFGYMLITRLLAALALALPMLFREMNPVIRVACASLAVGVGLVFGGLDFTLLRARSAPVDMGSRRFWWLLLSLLGIGALWVPLVLNIEALKEPRSPALSFGLVYLVMAAFAFCSPVDVRALDIKPSDTMRWSWRLALERFWVGVVGLNLLVFAIFGGAIITMLVQEGWRYAARDFQVPFFLGGLAAGLVGGLLAVRRLWSRGRVFAACTGCACIAMGGQLGSLADRWDFPNLALILIQLAVAAFVGVFGGFVSGMVNPERARRSGVWFWLRVPVLAFAVVGLLMLIPGIVVLLQKASRFDAEALRVIGVPSLMLGLGAGLVAFFRFGGFNGAQHFLLRWLFSRSGHLPPRPEAFLNHAAQLVLLQRVGFGYRFVHALLLQHLATAPENRTTPADSRADTAGT